MIKQSDSDSAAEAGKSTDLLAAENQALTHAGGPLTDESGAGRAGWGSGESQKGTAKPSGSFAKSDVPASNTMAPIVHTAMDDDLRMVEEQAHRTAGPAATE